MSDQEPQSQGEITEDEAARHAEETAELEALLPAAPEGQEALRAKADVFLDGCAVMAERVKGMAADFDTINHLDDLRNRVRGLRSQLDDHLDDHGQMALNLMGTLLDGYTAELHHVQSDLDQAARPLDRGNEELSVPVDNLVKSPDVDKAHQVAIGIQDLIGVFDAAVNTADYNLDNANGQLRTGLRNLLGNLPSENPAYPELSSIVNSLNGSIDSSHEHQVRAVESISRTKFQLNQVLSEIVEAKA
jgi:hypothetical protein